MAKDKEEKTKIVFQAVVKEVGEGEAKTEFSLKYNEGTGRFDLRKAGELLVSSVSIGDCAYHAKEHGVVLSPEELKVTFKTIG